MFCEFSPWLPDYLPGTAVPVEDCAFGLGPCGC